MKKAIRVLGIWIIAAVCMFFAICLRFRETLSLLRIDIKGIFSDNRAFLKHSFILIGALSVFFFCVLILTLITKNFKWTGVIKKKEFCIDTEDGSFRKVITVLVVLLLVAFVFLTGMIFRLNRAGFRRMFNPSSWNGDDLIMHAGGGIDGQTYTNSKNALENSCVQNAMTSEIDFALTTDDKLVCWHIHWKKLSDEGVVADEIMTYQEFMDHKIQDVYDPMSVETLFTMMLEQPELYVVTDTKADEKDQVQKIFRKLVETAEEMHAEEVLDRMVVQLYSHEMYEYVESVHHFNQYILTLYQIGGATGEDFLQHCRFCRRNEIDSITMKASWFTPEAALTARAYGIDVYVHTVNDLEKMQNLRSDGVRGVYTDFIFPSMLDMLE